MERITYRPSKSYVSKTTGDYVTAYSDYDTRTIINRLADYEDTGLTPAEVLSMSGEWCAMMSVLNSIGSYDRLMELAKADKEGRVAVLPCRVGDTVYFVSKRYKCINELTINSVESIVLLGKKWGKCVFVSREEAEKALEAKLNG